MLTPETIAWIAVAVCLAVILVQYIWLAILSYRQENEKRKYNQAFRTIEELLESILYSPTVSSMNSEIQALYSFVGKDKVKMDILSSQTLELLVSSKTDDRQKAAIVAVTQKIKPMDFFIKMLHRGNTFEKAYGCRKAAVYYIESEIPYIRKLSKSKNKVLAYNAAMALSSFGDEEAVAEIIQSYQFNYECSFRIILELLDIYSGDICSLAKRIFQNCDEYIKATVIKGLSDYKLSEFEGVYFSGLSSKNINLKIACIQALGKIGKPEYEHLLITAAHDINWVVRSTAVKQLVYNTDQTKKALVKATCDSEWWVRFNAAKTLVSIDPDLTYVENVLQGYDRYGSDAVKYILYRKYSLG
jgi:hypothetical protein